jgi:transient receptor potential cation channel subfamily C member 4
MLSEIETLNTKLNGYHYLQREYWDGWDPWYPREQWHPFDPMLLSEGMFSAAMIFR